MLSKMLRNFVVVAGLGGGALAQEERPKPLPKADVAAWEKAGAKPGWMGPNSFGRMTFRAGGEGKAGEVATFYMKQWKPGALTGLPGPEQVFGLCLTSTQMTDAGLKELAGLKHLQTLYLGDTQVTDAGLKELATLKQLKTLRLEGTEVTDAGFAELRKALPGCRIR